MSGIAILGQNWLKHSCLGCSGVAHSSRAAIFPTANKDRQHARHAKTIINTFLLPMLLPNFQNSNNNNRP